MPGSFASNLISSNLLSSKKNLNTNPVFLQNDYIGPNLYTPSNINPYQFNPEGSIFDPNPFFNSGGVGGNLVGPNANIFRPNQPKIPKYDPIGPFGNFGGPNQKKPFGKDPFNGNGGFI